MEPIWIDTHAHILSDALFEDFEEIKKNALKHNVKRICIICGSLKEIERAMDCVENDPMFDLAIGVHPGSVKDVSEDEFETMMSYLNHPQVKFLGEIGLDYYWDTSFNELQKKFFIQQIELANKHDLPITIHMRESTDDVFEILKNHPVKHKGIAHCFTEDVSSAKRFIELGFYVGIGGIVTFKNGENIKDLVRNLPFDKLLSETDSPYLAPVPKRGKRNEPAYVSYVGETISKLKDISIKETQKQLQKNYERLIQR